MKKLVLIMVSVLFITAHGISQNQIPLIGAKAPSFTSKFYRWKNYIS